nr:MAG TPA: hypothetical protein [Caudoviricetes sp.]
MEKINIGVRKLVEILLEDTEFVMERLPKSTMFGKTDEENKEHVYPILKKYYDFNVKDEDAKHLPFEASRVSRPTKKELAVFLDYEGFGIKPEYLTQFQDSVTSMVTVYYFTRIRDKLANRTEGEELLHDEELYLLIKWIEAMNLHIYLEEDNEETRNALQLYLIKTIAHLAYFLVKHAVPEIVKRRGSSLLLIGIELDYREDCFWVVYLETKDLEKFIKD